MFHQNFVIFPLDYLKIFFIIYTFIPESFPEISTNFFENFLKNLVKISIKFYLKTDQILVIVYPKFPENYLFFVEFHLISIKISSHLNIFTIKKLKFSKFFLEIYKNFGDYF